MTVSETSPASLTPAQALGIAQALERAGLSVDGLTATNPFARSDTPRARQVQAAVQAANPALAAELMAAGAPPSLAFVALQAKLAAGDAIDLAQLPAELREEVQQRLPQEVDAAVAKREADALAGMEEAAAALAARNAAGPSAEQQELEAMALADGKARMAAELRARSGLMR